MADALDIFREDALARRVKGIAGGNRIVWSAKDVVTIRDYVMAMPETIIRGAPTAARKFPDPDPATVRRKLAEAGVAVKREMQAGDLNFLAPITHRFGK